MRNVQMLTQFPRFAHNRTPCAKQGAKTFVSRECWIATAACFVLFTSACSTFEKLGFKNANANNEATEAAPEDADDERPRAATMRIFLASQMEELGGRTLKDDDETPFSLEPVALLTEGDLLDAYALHSDDASGILMHFTPFAADRLYRATAANIGKSLAILVNDEPITFVRIITAVRDDRPMIRGQWSRAEAEEIAESLRESLSTSGVF